MTHIEEKLYLQSIFDAIDEVYQIKTHQIKTLTYEERLRASFNKLLIPDWYNHDHISICELRKTTSFGQVSCTKQYDFRTSNRSMLSSHNDSSHLSNGKHRHRSPSRTCSERPTLRHHSTTSSNDTNECIVFRSRRSASSYEPSTYASGLQRVIQKSKWYKPKRFTLNGNDNNDHSNGSSKLLPRHSKINKDSTNLTHYSSLPSASNIIITDSISNENIQIPLTPRIMTQVPMPSVEIDGASSKTDNITIVKELNSSRTIDISSLVSTNPDVILHTTNSNNNISQSVTTTSSRMNSTRSISSDAESFHSMISALSNKNLQATDSSSYASVNEQCLSSTTTSLSYHTAAATDDISSTTDYETPTLKLDHEILSLHSSMSDLSNAETLEPNIEDFDIVAISKEEQKPTIIPTVNVGMENLPSSHILSDTFSPSSLLTSDSAASNEIRSIENSNWYDGGSIDTCIYESSALQSPSVELREIATEEILHEIDLNGVGNEFFLFSPRNTTDDEPSSSISDDKHDQDFEQLPKHMYTDENQTKDDFSLFDDFHCSSTVDPFGYKNPSTSIMITNLDDILVNDDDDNDDNDEEGNRFQDQSTYLLNVNYRRPIQEDILYEVEHENSYSDNSQNTTSIVIADDNISTKVDPNMDSLTTIEQPIKTDMSQTRASQQTSLQSDQINSLSNKIVDERKSSPINILPPTYTATQNSSSLYIDTSTYPDMYQYKLLTNQYSGLSLSSTPSSYIPKIRQRHFSVGSYYDNKTTTVAIHPNHTLYILGSAPVSPLNRATACETHYHSPLSYTNVALNTLRRITPYMETNIPLPNYDSQLSTSYNRDDHQQSISVPTIEQTQTVHAIQTESTSFIPSITSSSRSPPPLSVPIPPPVSALTPPSVSAPTSPPLPPSPPPLLSINKTSSVTIQEEEESKMMPKSPSPPPRFDIPLVRPKTRRGRVPSIPPTPPPRITSIEKEQTQSMSLDVDSTSSDNEKATTINDDFKFIRGTIQRVFDHHGGSTTSESSTCKEEMSQDKNDESISSSHSSSTLSNKSNQHPAVEAVQRFYSTKTSMDSEKKNYNQQGTTIDEEHSNSNSSTTGKLYSRSNPINIKIKDPKTTKSNSSDDEQASSEEVDDTLNDIEDDDYQDDKLKRQARNNSSHTSCENSPTHSSEHRTKITKTSQEVQTLNQYEQANGINRNISDSQMTIQSYETARSSAPPLDIVTQMVIEQSDSFDDGQIGEITGDMVIYYDDIEIVEHSSNISTTESDSISSISKSSDHAHVNESIPPPIPARALKPVHLLDNQQQSYSIEQNHTSVPPTSKINRTYELEKSTIRKKFDVNTVNTMLNRNDYLMGPITSHRHPSARHFAGKLNNDDLTLRNSSAVNSNGASKPSLNMTKSQTLPIQSINTNGHTTNNVQYTPTKNSFSTLPTRATSSVDTNALVKQLQTSLSRNSLHDTQFTSPLSISTKDLRTFVSSTYSPSDENAIDDDGIIHIRQQNALYQDDQSFKRQARLSKSFHNVSEYNSSDKYQTPDANFPKRTQPSKSVETNLNEVSRNHKKNLPMPLHFPPIAASTSFSTLPHSEDNARLLSMKWYTGQVSENSEICYNAPHVDSEDILCYYISGHGSREIQSIFARLQASSDIRIHAALDDIRLRVVQFDASKSLDDIHVFMRYLESRLRDIGNKNLSLSSTTTTTTTTSSNVNGQRRLSNGMAANGYHATQLPKSDTLSTKSRTSSIVTGVSKETPPPRQFGRQQLRSNVNKTGGETNGQQPPPPRRASQSSVNQENPAVFDDMLNTVLGLPKTGVPSPPIPSCHSSSQSREKFSPLTQTQISANTTAINKIGNDVGKRLFENGIFKDSRLIYDGARQQYEKEEHPLETSV